MLDTKDTPVNTIEIPLFGGRILLSKSREESKAILTAAEIEFDVDGVDGLTAKLPGHIRTMVSVFDGNIGTLAHEIAHATFFILGHAGVTVKAGKKNETFCYLLGDLMHKAAKYFFAEPQDIEEPAE